MKSRAERRQNAFIVNLTDDEAERLKQIAQANDHATSTQAYIIIRNYLNTIAGGKRWSEKTKSKPNT